METGNHFDEEYDWCGGDDEDGCAMDDVWMCAMTQH